MFKRRLSRASPITSPRLSLLRKGLLSGATLAATLSFFAAPYPLDHVRTVRRREILLATGLFAFVLLGLVGTGLCQKPFVPHLWIANLMNGDVHEYMLGLPRYRWGVYHVRPGCGGSGSSTMLFCTKVSN